MTTFGYTLKNAKLESEMVIRIFRLSFIEGTDEQQVREDIESYINNQDNFCEFATILSIERQTDSWVVVIEDYK